MDEPTFFLALLHEHYRVHAVTLERLSASSFEEGYLVYRIQHPNGRSWTARVYRRDRPGPDWFGYFYPWSTPDAADWLLTRAATLVYLEQQGYPAPQVIRTRTGNLLAMADGWCSLITTFIEGTVLQPTLAQLRLLGAALGRLHIMSPNRVAPGFPPVGKSNWYPEQALSPGLAHLASMEHLLSEKWLPFHAAFRQTFCLLTHRFWRFPKLCFPFCPPKLCFPPFLLKNKFLIESKHFFRLYCADRVTYKRRLISFAINCIRRIILSFQR